MSPVDRTPHITTIRRLTPAEELAFELIARAGHVTDWALGYHLKQRHPERTEYNTPAALRNWGRRILRQLEERNAVVRIGDGPDELAGNDYVIFTPEVSK